MGIFQMAAWAFSSPLYVAAHFFFFSIGVVSLASALTPVKSATVCLGFVVVTVFFWRGALLCVICICKAFPAMSYSVFTRGWAICWRIFPSWRRKLCKPWWLMWTGELVTSFGPFCGISIPGFDLGGFCLALAFINILYWRYVLTKKHYSNKGYKPLRRNCLCS